MYRIILLLIVVTLVFAGAVTAQNSGGQFCLRAFEDSNGNAVRDANEPLLTRGVSANLLDASGVVVASALLDSSPTAAQGIICFQFLAAGQYSMVVTSADFTPTTPVTLTANITDGAQPTVVDFGGRPLSALPTTAAPAGQAQPINERDLLARVAISGIGSLIIVVGMIVLGLIIYWLAFHNRLRQAAAQDVRQTTGSMRPVRTTDTGKFDL
jgi:hypothetical protein